MVEEEEEEEKGLEYMMEEEPPNPSYTTPPSTRGCSSPLTHVPTRSPTPEDLDLETKSHLATEMIESRIEAFLKEVEEDLELGDPPPLENSSPIPICAPLPEGFVAFPVSTSQHCVLSKGLPHPGYYHPYLNSLVKG